MTYGRKNGNWDDENQPKALTRFAIAAFGGTKGFGHLTGVSQQPIVPAGTQAVGHSLEKNKLVTYRLCGSALLFGGTAVERMTEEVKMKDRVKKLCRWLRLIQAGLANRMSLLGVSPFAVPAMTVLYATAAGIFLAAGSELVLNIFDEEQVEPWRLAQVAGVLFVATSVMFSLVAWFTQLFHDRLVRVGKQNDTLTEKGVQFSSWAGHGWAAILLVLALSSLVAAVVVSAFAVNARPNVQGPGICLEAGDRRGACR